MRKNARSDERGGIAMSLVLHLAVVLVGLSAAMLTVSSSSRKELGETNERVACGYVAEAAISNALLSLRQGGNGALGTAAAPISFGGGSYRTTCLDDGGNIYTVTAYATLRGDSRALRATVRKSGGIFNHSMFAGNASRDPSYVMKFGGTGTSADQVSGDVYSGNDILVAGSASLTGILRATGAITGAAGQTGVTQPIPDIAAMDYPHHNDVNVTNEFAANATYQSNAAGGSAWQVPQAMASHIFRLNPSDRTTLTHATAKDDYFLEDPYQPVRVDSAKDGSDAYMIKLSGSPGTPGTDGNAKVYFVDGNLWIDNYRTYSLKFGSTDAAGTQVTFVVRGNIYFSDSLFLSNPLTDGAAFIAMKDPAVADSGNVYFGDPTYGTLKRMQAFMYAENTFYDNSLDATGSSTVTVDGIMSAGDHVSINRDYGATHTKLTLNYDARVANNTLHLPHVDIPGAGGPQVAYSLVTMFEVSPQ